MIPGGGLLVRFQFPVVLVARLMKTKREFPVAPIPEAFFYPSGFFVRGGSGIHFFLP